jgi:prepilin-type N-terminal cleavage/methylation domain-containing protein
MRKEGFTLIELMIVIVIIAVIAAISIPNLLTGGISANETATVAGLTTLCSQEFIWKQQDIEGNGIRDYWTYDISCFNRMIGADGITKVNLIDISYARADDARAVDGVFGATPVFENWDSGATALTKAPKSGYWYSRLLNTFIGSGTLYQVNTVGTNKVAACHRSIFGFAAKPDSYGSSGVNMFIVNESGTVYATDPGGANAAWNCGPAAANPLTWPATTAVGSPIQSNGPGGKKWASVE